MWDGGLGERPVSDIVRAAAARDEEAWSALMERFAGLVWSVIRQYRLSSADAYDVSQTTWLRLAENIGSLREPDRVGSWLATTARRECLAVLRGSARQTPTDLSLFEVADPNRNSRVDAELLRMERDAELWEALECLSPSNQALLRMLFADSPPRYEEIASAIGIRVGSIGPTRRRCLMKLRTQLDGATA